MANNIERWSLKTMYEMRGYVYTEDETFFSAAHQNLIKVNNYIKEADEHGAKSSTLAQLKQAADNAENKQR